MTLSKHLYFLTQSYHMTLEDFSKALWSLAASIIHFHCIEKKQPRHSAKLLHLCYTVKGKWVWNVRVDIKHEKNIWKKKCNKLASQTPNTVYTSVSIFLSLSHVTHARITAVFDMSKCSFSLAVNLIQFVTG